MIEPEVIISMGNVYSQITPMIKEASDCLCYQKSYWKQGEHARKEKTYSKSLIDRKGVFLTGYVERLVEYLRQKKIHFEIEDNGSGPPGNIDSPPNLSDVEFREWQLNGFAAIEKRWCGYWIAPMGAGKTILSGGIVSMFPEERFLILVGTKGSLKQTKKDYESYFPDEKIGIIGDGQWDEQEITIATFQTLRRYVGSKGKNWKAFCTSRWGGLIVDECDTLGTFGGKNVKLINSIRSTIRIGLTGTEPESVEGKLILEGIFGPKLGETDQEQLIEKGELAKPKMKIIWVPDNGLLRRLAEIKESDKLKKIKRRYDYKFVYDLGIVNNRLRNSMIIKEAFDLIDDGLTVLILVERIDHGHNLLKMANKKQDDLFCFLDGMTKDSIREKEKEKFERQERKGVIASRIWARSINIKSVGGVVNAVGGLSEASIIQRFGRGFRVTERKNVVFLLDFFDSNHNYFLRHSGKRLALYFEKNWI